jgi:hypothetical protein
MAYAKSIPRNLKFYDLNEDIKQKKDLDISVKIALQANMRNMSGSLDC